MATWEVETSVPVPRRRPRDKRGQHAARAGGRSDSVSSASPRPFCGMCVSCGVLAFGPRDAGGGPRARGRAGLHGIHAGAPAARALPRRARHGLRSQHSTRVSFENVLNHSIAFLFALVLKYAYLKARAVRVRLFRPSPPRIIYNPRKRPSSRAAAAAACPRPACSSTRRRAARRGRRCASPRRQRGQRATSQPRFKKTPLSGSGYSGYGTGYA